MKKTLLIAALASAALVSCSKDQVVEQQQDEIKFSVVADNATKAAHVYCSNNLMTSFTVSADYNNNTVYIVGDEMTVDPSNGAVTAATNSQRYWPDMTSATMKFYAVSDGTMKNGRVAGTAPSVEDFTIERTVTAQKDLLYALTETDTKGTVALNFRHALSLIEFKAKVTNTNLKVSVTGVRVGKVINKGTFTFPTGSTLNDKNNEHTDNEDEFNHNAELSAWDLGNTTDTYEVTFSPIDLSTEQNLTYLTHSGTRNTSNSMILMPQTLNTPWSTGLPAPDDKFTTTTKSYLAVQCTICNNDASSTPLYSGWAYMPLGAAAPSPTWEPGKKYVYTFVFGTGKAGYDENGQPVLAPIDYTVTVDDFDAFTGGNTDVEME